MPLFVPQEELDTAQQLREENARMARELAGYEEMRPLLELAKEVRTEIVNFLDGRPDLNAQEISEQAYQNVLARNMHKARDEVAARYEQEHRRNLYQRLLGEVATAEGDTISEQVRQKVETDPEVARELRQSARKELAARATDVVRAEITTEQQAIIDHEAERQIALDRLDVKLALDRELDLTSTEVTSRIKPGDKVELFFEAASKKRGRIELTWMKDAKGKEGWVYTGSNEKLFSEGGYGFTIDENRFVDLGVVNRDMENGKQVLQIDHLAIGLQLVLVQKSDNGGTKKQKLTYREGNSASSYNSQFKPVELLGTDFQTKDIVFTNASGQ